MKLKDYATKCKIIKTKDNFILSQWKTKISYCRECRSQIEHKQLKKLKDDPEFAKQKWIKRKYNLSLEEFNEMKLRQKNLCAICKQNEKSRSMYNKGFKDLSIDHCHREEERGIMKIRGLLCHHCNSLLGYARDNIEILISAIEYLKSY